MIRKVNVNWQKTFLFLSIRRQEWKYALSFSNLYQFTNFWKHIWYSIYEWKFPYYDNNRHEFWLPYFLIWFLIRIWESKGHSTEGQRSRYINVRKLFKGGNCMRKYSSWYNENLCYRSDKTVSRLVSRRFSQKANKRLFSFCHKE